MDTDAINDAARRINASIRAAFPDDASAIDGQWEDDSPDLLYPNLWLEGFSQRTTDAINSGDLVRAAAHLKLLSGLLDGADQRTTRCIDVGYVESLMWNIEDEELKARGWKLMPENLCCLYIAMWGERTFMHR